MKYSEIDSNMLFIASEHKKEYCKSREITSLARSIGKVGLLIPITVKPLLGGGGYEIISGNKRFCACKLIGIKKIPCMIIEKNQDPTLIFLTIKRFKESDPFELAENIKNVLVKGGISAEKLAYTLGMETSELIEFLTPAYMSGIEREISKRNLINSEKIRKISSLPDKESRLSALTANTSHLLKNKAPENKHARRIISLKNIGFFENTLKRSLKILENAGFHTAKETREQNGNVEYRIKVFGANKI